MIFILFSEGDVKKHWFCSKEDKTHKLRIHYDLFYAKAKDDFIKHVINTLKSCGREDGFFKNK